MKRTVRLWPTSIAAAALLALPLIAAAHTYPPTSGQSNPSSHYSTTDRNSPRYHFDQAKRVLDSISTSELTGEGATPISKIKTQYRGGAPSRPRCLIS